MCRARVVQQSRILCSSVDTESGRRLLQQSIDDVIESKSNFRALYIDSYVSCAICRTAVWGGRFGDDLGMWLGITHGVQVGGMELRMRLRESPCKRQQGGWWLTVPAGAFLVDSPATTRFYVLNYRPPRNGVVQIFAGVGGFFVPELFR